MGGWKVQVVNVGVVMVGVMIVRLSGRTMGFDVVGVIVPFVLEYVLLLPA